MASKASPFVMSYISMVVFLLHCASWVHRLWGVNRLDKLCHKYAEDMSRVFISAECRP